MKNKIYIALICAFSILLAVSSGFLIKHYIDSEKQSEIYDNLIETVEKTDTEKDTMISLSTVIINVHAAVLPYRKHCS